MTQKKSIWVDADACPVPVKEMLLRAAERAALVVTFVANQFLQLPNSRHVVFLQVANGLVPCPFPKMDKPTGVKLNTLARTMRKSNIGKL